MGFDLEAGWGGNYLNELIDGSSKNNYTTVGIPTNEFNINKLYDLDWEQNGWRDPSMIGGGWPKRKIVRQINKGVHIINHVGHSSQNVNLRLMNPGWIIWHLCL